MRIYSVHIRRGGLDLERDVVLVKEGFSWPAAIFGTTWALWYGLWGTAAAMFLLEGGLFAAARGFGIGWGSAVFLMVGTVTVIGFVANDLYRASLERRGFVLRDTVAAPNRETAEHRFFDRTPALATEMADSVGGAPP